MRICYVRVLSVRKMKSENFWVDPCFSDKVSFVASANHRGIVLNPKPWHYHGSVFSL
jgi:hypothetical protein